LPFSPTRSSNAQLRLTGQIVRESGNLAGQPCPARPAPGARASMTA
jgi:hypothetical protein